MINDQFCKLPKLKPFPANVPTREHDFFHISSQFHVENDVVLWTS